MGFSKTAICDADVYFEVIRWQQEMGRRWPLEEMLLKRSG